MSTLKTKERIHVGWTNPKKPYFIAKVKRRSNWVEVYIYVEINL